MHSNKDPVQGKIIKKKKKDPASLEARPEEKKEGERLYREIKPSW